MIIDNILKILNKKIEFYFLFIPKNSCIYSIVAIYSSQVLHLLTTNQHAF